MTEPRRDIGQFIREQRNLAELSVRRLADLAGVSNPYLSQIERGLRKPSAEILLQIAQALEVSAETMYIQAGMLDADAQPPSADLETAIRNAQELTEDQRKALLSVYRSFVAAGSDAGSAAADEGASSAGEPTDAPSSGAAPAEDSLADDRSEETRSSEDGAAGV